MTADINLYIRAFHPKDEEKLVKLWQRCNLTRPWNDPHDDITSKIAEQPDLLLVAERGGNLIGSIMAGYEGHRGWINYLAVDPACRLDGVGRALMNRAEQLLLERGCPKINLQVRKDNVNVIAFYEKLGYGVEQTISMGKRLDGKTP